MLFFSFYKGVCIIIVQHERREIMTTKFFNALLSSLHIFSSVKFTWYTITYVYAYMLTDQIPCWRYRRNLQCISRFHLNPLTTHHARMRLIITLHSKTCTVHMACNSKWYASMYIQLSPNLFLEIWTWIWKPFIWMLSRIIISWVFQYTFGYVYLKFSICVLYVTQYYVHVNVRCKIIGIEIYHPNLMKHHICKACWKCSVDYPHL